MGRGGQHDGAAAGHRHQPFEFCGIGRRRGNVELQIAGDDHVGAAKRGKAFGIGLGLREANIELLQQRRDRAGDAAPAREGALRHPSVDQHHRQPPRGALQDQVRPQIGFDEQRQRRPPVIEEARDITRGIVGHILVDDVGRKAPRDDRRRRHRARGQEDADVQRAQPLDQGGGRQHLADARAMNPDQRAVRPRIARQPAPLGDSRRILLAELEPSFDQRRRQRHHRGRQPAIDAERHRQRASHVWLPRSDRPADRRAASPRSECFRPSGDSIPSQQRRHPPAHGLPRCRRSRRARTAG